MIIIFNIIYGNIAQYIYLKIAFFLEVVVCAIDHEAKRSDLNIFLMNNVVNLENGNYERRYIYRIHQIMFVIN